MENKAGGIIQGDTTAMAMRPDSSPYSYSSTSITNAGTIIGHVDLSGGNSSDRFVMQQGGTVSGDIRLGAGSDTYIFNGTMGANGFLTGISGVLDGGAGSDQLLARFNADADIALGNAVNFETIGLDIGIGKLVNLAGTTGGAQLSLYGNGTADLSLPISGQNVTLINASGYGFSFPGDTSGSYAQTGTTIISRGALSAAFDSTVYGGSVIQLDQLDRFTNGGSVTLTQATNPYGTRASAINGGKEVANKGEIVLNGGSGIAGALTVINSGTIIEAGGGASAVGVSSFRDLTNSGTIRTSGGAVFASDYSSSAIRNSGTIESTGTRAILGGYAPTVIVNEPGGTITGGAGFDAIALSGGGAVGNAGMINGNVNLGYSSYGGTSYASGAYVDRGGTLNGDLLFGAGNDIFVATSEMLGVLGSIDGGDGADSFIRAYDASKTVDLNALSSLPVGFERQGVGALGEGTVVTLTASNGPVSQPLTLAGDGMIVNQANFSATDPWEQVLTLGSSIDPLNLSGAGSTLDFINRGTINGAVGGYAASFENEGTIGNSAIGMAAVTLTASSEEGFRFRNSGTIASSGGSPFPFFAPVTGVTLYGPSSGQVIGEAVTDNSGTIKGALSASLYATDFSFSNEGAIEPGTAYVPSISLSIGQSYYGNVDVNANSAALNNGGSLTNGLNAAIAAKSLNFSNRGTIGSTRDGFALSLIQSAHQTGDTTQGLYGAIDQESLAFANSGTLNGSGYLYSSATSIAVTNSGTINAPASSLVPLDDAALAIEGNSQRNQIIAFNNSGQISTDRLGASAVTIESDARSVEQLTNGFDEAAGPIDGGPATTVTVANSGTLSADGGASYRPATFLPYPWYPPIQESLNLVAGLSIDASSGGLSSIVVTNEAGGVISAIGATRNAANAQRPLVADLENIGSTAFVGSANQITLVNAGTIRGLEGGIVPAGLLVDPTASDQNFAGQFLAGAIQTINSADTVTNLATGVISGSVDLGALDDRMANFGTINSNVYLDEGNDRFTHRLGATLNGPVDGGTATDALTIDITGGGLLDQATLDKFVNFESQSITGTGTITTNGPLALDSLILRDANLTLAAGQTYELITTTSGIIGSFSTIDKASTVVGFVRQGNRSIDLLGQFVLGSGASGQVTQTVDYLNGLLIAGTATSGILNAAPSLLLPDGTVNQAVVSRLNAESYASAAQIGIENGLAIASALRTASTSARNEEAGLFTFGQTLGGWRRLPGDAALGTSRADISTYGALAGIGFGSQVASIGAFVGYVDARQQIGALQTKTEADSILAGVVTQATLSGFTIAASLSYDGSKGDTDRSLFGGSKVSSHYRLRSWTADISLGHAFGLGDGWSIEPQIGFTHISSRRGSANETVDAVWALDVDGRCTRASFLRGELELHGAAEAPISPWLSAGVLNQLSGTRSFATAAYAGVPDGLTVAGARRSETLATVGTGVNLRVSSAATLYFGANSEFGAESSGQSATAGLRIRF